MDIDIEKIKQETSENLQRSKKILISIFLISVGIFILLILSAPEVSEEDRKTFLTFPRSVNQIQALYTAVETYTKTSYWYVLTLFCFLYLLLQSFAIPGPLILSILSGALFGRWMGLFYVSLCATSGASLCYTLSSYFGKGIIVRIYPEKVLEANKKIKENSSNLFFYMLFVRISPIIPNWLINVSSPIIGVPFVHFFASTFIGLMPANCIHINAGMTLASIEHVGLSYSSMLFLLVLAFIALIPVLVFGGTKQKNP
jgi:uncharacterized membrane protein YdjX (TVP38/TMEM64 family)